MSESIQIGNMTRTFHMVGDRDGQQRDRAAVLVFHGSRQTGPSHQRFTGHAYDAIAADGSAVVAYLDGYRGNWNDARAQSFFPARTQDIDDVGFVQAVIDQLAAGWGVDRTRVFAAGYSNGGQLVFRLLHEAPHLLAGAVVAAAAMPTPDSFRTDIQQPTPIPVPIVLAHGTKDRITPYRGGEMRGLKRALFKVGGTTMSAPDTAAYFAARNGMTAPPTRSTLDDVQRTDHTGPGTPPVSLLTVIGGGHTVPGPKRAPFLFGRTTSTVSMADQLARLMG